jgi:hypothetical protein
MAQRDPVIRYTLLLDEYGVAQRQRIADQA